MEESWVLDLKRQAKHLDIPFLFEQQGSVFTEKRGPVLEEREWNERPLKLA